jgi:acyl-CoA synthetase (AMP-forming)/AMP-acid ligase II
MSSGWNYADVWESVAAAVPQRQAQLHGDVAVTWDQFDRAANGLARTLVDAGCERQAKVALYLYNGPAYLQAAFGCMKAALVPVNTNYRYQQDELHYLWDNADAAAVVFHGSFLPTVDAVRTRCTKVRLWLHVDDGSHPCPSWAMPDEQAAGAQAERFMPAWGRSGDDQVLIYTGGTTGRPRGVMWRQHDLFVASNTSGDPATADLEHVRRRVLEAPQGSAPVGVPAAPLMHGTAFVFASAILNRAGTVLTLPGQSFDVEALLQAIGEHGATDLCIVGDAFGRPMVDALDAQPQRWNLRTLKAISSSGMMWSNATKEQLLVHAPDAVLVDFLNSSEASGMGRAISSQGRSSPSARFKLGRNAFVLGDDDQPLAPGCGIPGRIAVSGNVPLGYYGDPVKTAATFPVINGVRCAVPGDYALVEADGSITLLGRGSVSINTGGEKVFPEEVEECLKRLPQVRDAVVVGVPDPRFGEVVAAAVETVDGVPLDAAVASGHVREHLARHKAPRHVMTVPSLGRGPNGKADYVALRQRVANWLARDGARDGSPPIHPPT